MKSAALCWVLNAPYDVVGGVGNRFRAEVEHFVQTDFQVEVICRRTATPHPKARISVLHAETRLLPFLLLEISMKALIIARRLPRVVFIAHDPLSALAVSLATRLMSRWTRSILVVHGPMAFEQRWLARGRIRGAILGLLLVAIERIAYRITDKLIAVSEYERKYLIDRYGIKNKIRLIRNGIQIQRFDLKRNDKIRNELHVRSDEILITNVGHLYTYRGLSELFEAIAMAKRSPHGRLLKLIVVGRPKGLRIPFSTFVREVEALGIGDAVRFLGDRKDIPQILAGSDIYSGHFSRKVDGIGIAIMEAMAAGLPVITGRDWITSGLLTDGMDCILVNKEDSRAIMEAILSLARDRSLRSQIGLNAQITAKQIFSVERMLKECESEYTETSFPRPFVSDCFRKDEDQ